MEGRKCRGGWLAWWWHERVVDPMRKSFVVALPDRAGGVRTYRVDAGNLSPEQVENALEQLKP